MPEALKARGGAAPALRNEDRPAEGYSYRDYLSWGEDVRCELIDGIPHMMAGPSMWHQRVAGEIYRQLGNWLEGKACMALIAPFDVRLFPEDDDSDKVVVQPDVFVVCDREKLSDGKACKGAPDFAVEVASAGSAKKDFVTKRILYEKAGVREYWVVDDEEVYTYALSPDGRYLETAHALAEDTEIGVAALPGCRIGFRNIIRQALGA